MARTPSMSREDAEAALGPRGSLFVTAQNKPIVRKWLTARGVPGLYAAALAMKALQAAYNNELDFERIAAQAATHIQEFEPSEPALEPNRMPVEGNGHAPSHAAQLEALLREIAGGAATVDIDTVRTVVDARFETLTETLPDLIARNTPVTRLEIKMEHKVLDLGVAPRHQLLPDMITALAAGIPVALIGPAGSGKTTAVEQAAQALDAPFYMNGAISGAHEYLGFKDAHGAYHSTPFRQAFEHGGVYCADEIDAGDPCAILVINSALANGHMPFPDQVEPVKKHPNFRMVACANTFMLGADRVYVGRNQLDAATIDRFCVFNWTYDERLERELCANATWCQRVQALRAAAVAEKARVIISPRASIYGAKLLDAGMTPNKVEDLLVWKGIDLDTRRRIEGRVS